MRLEWIEDILAVAETGSFIKAAERRYLTQSAFSRRIRTIEDHIGAELFDRTQKPVRLNAKVQEGLAEMAELASRLRSLASDLRHQSQKSQMRIAIACQHAITTSIAPSLVQRLASSHEIAVRLRSANREECYALLLTRQADILLLHSTELHPLIMDNGFVEEHILGTEKLVPVFAASRLDELMISLEQCELPVVVYPESVFLGRVLRDEIFPRMPEMSFKPKAETALTLAALQFAMIGMAVAWVPETLARAHTASKDLVDLSETLGSQSLKLMAIHRKGAKTPIEQEVWNTIVAQGIDMLSGVTGLSESSAISQAPSDKRQGNRAS